MLIRLNLLLKHIVDPRTSVEYLWGCNEFTPDDVIYAYKNKEFCTFAPTQTERILGYTNICRIAYFMKRMPLYPIEIDVGIPSLGYHQSDFILDGWHRIYAAIMRRDKYIHANISGEIEFICKTICPGYRANETNRRLTLELIQRHEKEAEYI